MCQDNIPDALQKLSGPYKLPNNGAICPFNEHSLVGQGWEMVPQTGPHAVSPLNQASESSNTFSLVLHNPVHSLSGDRGTETTPPYHPSPPSSVRSTDPACATWQVRADSGIPGSLVAPTTGCQVRVTHMPQNLPKSLGPEPELGVRSLEL